MLISRGEYKLSPKAIRSSELFRRYAGPFYERTDDEFSVAAFHSDFEKIYGALYFNAQSAASFENALQFENGDIIGIHSGGRHRAPDGSPIKGSDTRRWLDAKIPLGNNPRLNFYGATGVGLGNGVADEVATTTLSREQLSVGGGFGFSYRLGENAELLFDYRHSRPLDSDSVYTPGNAAGFTIHLSF